MAAQLQGRATTNQGAVGKTDFSVITLVPRLWRSTRLPPSTAIVVI